MAQDAATGLLSSDVKGWHLAPGVLGKVMPPDRIAASIVNSTANGQDGRVLVVAEAEHGCSIGFSGPRAGLEDLLYQEQQSHICRLNLKNGLCADLAGCPPDIGLLRGHVSKVTSCPIR